VLAAALAGCGRGSPEVPTFDPPQPSAPVPKTTASDASGG